MVQEDVGLIAINDSFYLECTIYTLLRKHFRHLPYYTDLLDLFLEVSNFSFSLTYFVTAVTCVKRHCLCLFVL